MNIKVVYSGPDQCERCGGYGQVDHEGTGRQHWEELPAQSRVALTMGLVDFTDCPECNGTGRAPRDVEGEAHA